MKMNIPFIGEVGTGTLVLGGVAALIGYVIGSQLKSALKFAIIILIVAGVVGLITPAMMGQLAEIIAALKPLYENYLNTANFSVGTLGFFIGFVIGLWKG
jgi:hypothetical protein